MLIYLGHSTAFNYEDTLYLPLKNSALWAQHSFILPHENQADLTPTKKLIQTIDLMVAEVSYPSTGLGIELGWANNANRDILCVSHQDARPSLSLKYISQYFLTYSDPKDLIHQLTTWIQRYL